MTKKSRTALLLGAAVTTLITVSACGSGTSGAKSAQAAASPAASVVAGAASVAPSPSAAAADQLAVRDDPQLKSVVADGRGMTLYVFDKDTTPGTSACTGDCATLWPPVPADNVTVSQGLNQDLLGSLTRTDGTKQLTLAGKPLYYYAKDTKPGDTKGQGVGGVWYASAPDGWKAGVTRPALGVLDDPKLGKVLQDKDGRTLYLFTKDHPWPMKTACGADCLAQWTPTAVVGAADAKAAGLPEKALFTFTTPNGTRQESFNCWPGYTFKADTMPGQTNGQNVAGVWFAVKQDITAIDRGKTIPAAKGDGSSTAQDGAGSTSGTGTSTPAAGSGTGY
ncbi:SCO0930 family lipoprotein [Streptomyces sp. NBC_01497]|uniref:SCO0930 family lipoprotein n=1 Tax=Streptomyces sp. NBC_01497 TaxID=2903885 RepID=UPI002E338410|nr:SCO0930 family lipoprotein [Streptomyces sp. NBC_01497]